MLYVIHRRGWAYEAVVVGWEECKGGFSTPHPTPDNPNNVWLRRHTTAPHHPLVRPQMLTHSLTFASRSAFDIFGGSFCDDAIPASLLSLAAFFLDAVPASSFAACVAVACNTFVSTHARTRGKCVCVWRGR
jgi:hypothetical protein